MASADGEVKDHMGGEGDKQTILSDVSTVPGTTRHPQKDKDRTRLNIFSDK